MSRPAASASDRHGASYRDPAGYVFRHQGNIYRAIHEAYAPHYGHLMSSGLYAALTAKGYLIPHDEISPPHGTEGAWKVIRPQPVSLWTYPGEWGFAQLQAAALHTLRVARIALDHGALLKDASAYNIQFIAGRPVLTDSLSFEIYKPGAPWIAFRQACEHFLNPLLLMSRLPDCGPSLFLAWPEGVPARLVAGVLPAASKLRPDYALYVHLPAALGVSKSAKTRRVGAREIGQNIDRLAAFIRRLKPAASRTVWNHYYDETILSQDYLQAKESAVEALLAGIPSLPQVLDIGCNTGAFARIAARHFSEVIALDADSGSIDALYRALRSERIRNIQPIVADLLHPTPATGWMNREWESLLARVAGVQLVLALAVVHHLALGRNVPLPMIADCFASITARWLIVEWIPKSDEKAMLLLVAKGDHFPDYSEEGFEAAFGQWFRIEERIPVAHSGRLLYLMERKEPEVAASI